MSRPNSSLRSWVFNGWWAVRLVRPENVLMIGAAVWLGMYLSTGNVISFVFLSAATSAMLLAISGNVMNDILDRSIDEVNHPNRALPSGRASTRLAWSIMVSSFALSLAALAFLPARHAAVFAATALLLVLYNAFLKRLPLVGNLAVAMLASLAIIYGSLETTIGIQPLVAAGFAFTSTLAREIVKDVSDMKGDSAAGLKTLPILVGRKYSIRIVNGLSLGTVAASVLPFLLLDYGGLFLLVVLCADVFLFKSVIGPDSALYSTERVSTTLKMAMILGMLALACSEIVPTP